MDNKKAILPNLIVGGPGRTGTTSLFLYLLHHPEICGSAKKETDYFLDTVFHKPLSSIDSYAQFFANCKDRDYKYIMEATPAYFLGGRNIANIIKKVLGNFMVIFTLREPTDRFLSGYRYIQNNVLYDKPVSIEEYLEHSMNTDLSRLRAYEELSYAFLSEGRYANHLKGWLDIIGKENMHIMFYEELISNQKETISDLFAWLGISADDISVDFPFTNKAVDLRFPMIQKIGIKINRAGEPFFNKHQKLKNIIRDFYYLINERRDKQECPGHVREYLENYYREPNRELLNLLKEIGVDKLPQWLVNA